MMDDAKEVLVEPIANEIELRNWDWIERNPKKVAELSEGKLAYVYVPNTGGIGFSYFNRYYFAQQDKKASSLMNEIMEVAPQRII